MAPDRLAVFHIARLDPLEDPAPPRFDRIVLSLDADRLIGRAVVR